MTGDPASVPPTLQGGGKQRGGLGSSPVPVATLCRGNDILQGGSFPSPPRAPGRSCDFLVWRGGRGNSTGISLARGLWDPSAEGGDRAPGTANPQLMDWSGQGQAHPCAWEVASTPGVKPRARLGRSNTGPSVERGLHIYAFCYVPCNVRGSKG